MRIQLLVCLSARRKAFIMEDFIGSNDIFALVKTGSFSFSSEGISHTVSALEGALFRSGVLYHREVKEPLEMILFRFKADEPLFFTDKITFRDTDRIRSTIAMLQQLDRGIYQDEFEMRASLFSDIAVQYRLEQNAEIPAATDDPIRKAIARISEDIHKNITIGELSLHSGLSHAQFIRRFRRITGMTPSEYLALLRLQKAKSLLTDTDLLIREIAPACGFENENYFSNFFKKHTGTSPSAYRSFTLR